jgi:glutamate--cysteine ligase
VRVGGEYRQLNANVLQIENEYYSLVRPKRRARPCERPTHALQRAGVQYVELRSLDVNPFEPNGVHVDEMRFLEALALWCLLHDSPPITPEEQREIDHNQQEVARFGRKPGCELQRHGSSVRLADWAREICAELAPLAELLDAGLAERPFARVIADAQAAIEDATRTPSARVLEEMRSRGESFVARAALFHGASSAWDRYVLAPARLAELEEQARSSPGAIRVRGFGRAVLRRYLSALLRRDDLCDQPATS